MKEKKQKNTEISKEELTNLLKKTQADFENYKKRVEKEQKEIVKYACGDVIKELLPVLDSFELALKNSPTEEIKALYAQIWQILEQKGLYKIKAEGKEFDPYLHEALLQEKKEGIKENTVIEELQPGYKLGEQIIRHAKVKISK